MVSHTFSNWRVPLLCGQKDVMHTVRIHTCKGALIVCPLAWCCDQTSISPVISQDISWFQNFLQISLCLRFAWKKRSSHQGKKEVACIVSKPLVSCLWGCRESVNPPKIKHPVGWGGFVLLTKGETQARYPFFQDFLLLSNDTPDQCNNRSVVYKLFQCGVL